MKKIIYLLCLMMLLSSCTNRNPVIEDLSGSYSYQECVYLSPFSSATLDYMTSLHEGKDAISFLDDDITYVDTLGETYHFQQITYHKEDIYHQIDPVIHDGISSVFDRFQERYDIYDHDVYTGITLYFIDEEIYLAEIILINTSSTDYLVKVIYKLQIKIADSSSLYEKIMI